MALTSKSKSSIFNNLNLINSEMLFVLWEAFFIQKARSEHDLYKNVKNKYISGNMFLHVLWDGESKNVKSHSVLFFFLFHDISQDISFYDF